MQRRALQFVLFFSLVGLGLSIYSFLHHESFVPGTFCDLSATFNCDVVNRGVFSEILGVPVALLGIIGYLFIGLTTVLRLRDTTDPLLRTFAVVLALGGLAFTLYLTGLEAFVLHAWCIICLSSQLTMLGIFTSTLVSLRKTA